MSTVRQLAADEVGKVIPIGEIFHAASKLPGRFNPAHFETAWRKLVNDQTGAIFVVEDGPNVLGTIGGIGFPDLNTGDLAVAESFWFMRPENRGGMVAVRLFNAYEDWAVNVMKAKVVFMTHLSHLTPSSLRRLYEKNGYREVETHFLKEVK